MNIFKDDKLKAIYVIDDKTSEIYCVIKNDGTLIQKGDVKIISDYADENVKRIEERDGKFYFTIGGQNE